MLTDPAIWVANQFYTKLVGKVLPAKWFGVTAPPQSELSLAQGKINLDIVSHCWQYSHLLVYQLSSLANYPPAALNVRYRLFYATEDSGTKDLIETFGQMEIPGVTWEWNPISKEELFRRAIGRNRAAKSSRADWMWFSDCDLIFHKDCLDSLATSLQGLQTGLVFPASEQITELLAANHPLIAQSLDQPLPIDIDPSIFFNNKITKAKGAFQIVHGDVARAVGYCDALPLYQQPDKRWRKTYEDTVFRNLIGYEGLEIDVRGLHRIRHSAKGRYTKNSNLSKARSRLRHITD